MAALYFYVCIKGKQVIHSNPCKPRREGGIGLREVCKRVNPLSRADVLQQ